MKTKKEKVLPKELSKLLRIAVRDMRACQKMPSRRLNMVYWLKQEGKACIVCMAGAVMDRTLRVQSTGIGKSVYNDGQFLPDGVNSEQLVILDSLRLGMHPEEILFYADTFLTNGQVTNVQRKAVADSCRLIRDNLNKRLHRAPLRIYEKAARILEKAGF